MTKKYLSGLYNNKNGIKMEFIQNVRNKGIILRIVKVKRAIIQPKAQKKLK